MEWKTNGTISLTHMALYLHSDVGRVLNGKPMIVPTQVGQSQGNVALVKPEGEEDNIIMVTIITC